MRAGSSKRKRALDQGGNALDSKEFHCRYSLADFVGAPAEPVGPSPSGPSL